MAAQGFKSNISRVEYQGKTDTLNRVKANSRRRCSSCSRVAHMVAMTHEDEVLVKRLYYPLRIPAVIDTWT